MATSGQLADSEEVPKINDTDVYYLASLYGIPSWTIERVSPLPSYEDKVFHIVVYEKFIDKQKGIIPLVMKCSICNSFDRVDMQLQAMQRLYENRVASPKPIPLATNNVLARSQHHPFIYVTCNHPLQHENSKHAEYKVNVHCMSFIEGGMLASDIDKTQSSFLRNLGETVGRLTLALQDFEHQAADFKFSWDLQQASIAFPKILYVADAKLRTLLTRYIANYNEILLPYVKQNKLRTSIIHMDLNDCNLLVNAIGEQKKVTGILDFGDCKRSCTAFEIVICIAYFMLGQSRGAGLLIMDQILKSYHKVYPLTANELDIVWVAICSRILVSVLTGAAAIAARPENTEYLMVHAGPGRTFLTQYADIDPMTMAKRLKQMLLYDSKL